MVIFRARRTFPELPHVDLLLVEGRERRKTPPPHQNPCRNRRSRHRRRARGLTLDGLSQVVRICTNLRTDIRHRKSHTHRPRQRRRRRPHVAAETTRRACLEPRSPDYFPATRRRPSCVSDDGHGTLVRSVEPGMGTRPLGCAGFKSSDAV